MKFLLQTAAVLVVFSVLSGCVVTNDYVAFDSKAAPNPQVQNFDANSWASERAVILAAEKTNNWPTVISVANDVIAKNPTNVEARVHLARALTKTGDPAQALRVLNFVTGVDTSEMRIERARALLTMGDAASTLKILSPMIDLRAENAPKDLSAQNLRTARSLAAVSYSMEKKFAQANALFESLLAELDNPTIRYNYARSLYLEGRAQDSLEQLRTIMDVIPAARPAAVAALMKLGREADARLLLQGHLEPAKIDELIAAIKQQEQRP